MSFQITTGFKKQFRDNIIQLTQQKGSRLRETVMVDTEVAGKETFVDQIGATEAVDVTTRHADTPLVSTPHARRRLSCIDSDWADLVDKFDVLKTMNDPTNKYALNARDAFGRKMDDRIIAAATADAYTGEEGGTTVQFDTNMSVAVDFKEDGTTANSNLTLGKLRRAKFLLDANEVDEGPGERFFVYTASQLNALLRDDTLTRIDYNDVKALVDGKLDYFLGFTFRRTQRLTVASSVRTCLFYHRTGIMLGVAQDINVQIGPRADKRYSTQVYVSMSTGATRLEEVKVGRVLALETV